MTAPIAKPGDSDPPTSLDPRPERTRVTAATPGRTRPRSGKGIGSFGGRATAARATVAAASSALAAPPTAVTASSTAPAAPPTAVAAPPEAVATPLGSSYAGVTEVISGLPIATPAAADVDTAPAETGNRRKKLAIVLGATVGVGLAAAGIVWGLHGKDAGTSTPVGVLPVTGQTPTDPGGLVPGGQPINPQPATSPQFGPNPDPLPPAPPPPSSGPPPPDPYASYPGLNTAPTGPLAKPSPRAADLPPPDPSLGDDLDDQSLSDTGLDDPSYDTAAGSPNSFQPQSRPDARRYGSGGYRDQDRSDGPLGSLGDHDGGPRRGPADTVPHLGGLSGR